MAFLKLFFLIRVLIKMAVQIMLFVNCSILQIMVKCQQNENNILKEKVFFFLSTSPSDGSFEDDHENFGSPCPGIV